MTKALKSHPYLISAFLCVLFWLLTGGTLRTFIRLGLTIRTCMIIYLVIMGIVLAAFVVTAILKKLTDEHTCLFIALGGTLARMWYALYSQTDDSYQHDFGNFDYDFQYAVHDNYILYLLKNIKLPDFDFRGTGQFYHPPLHHIISAIAIKINSVIFPDKAGNYEILMCISLFYSLATLILIYKILRYFGFEGLSLKCAFALASFYPFMIIHAGQINNDPLASLLFIAGFYQALLWYREPGFKRIIYTAVCIGCAMMTKISAGLIALPVGFIFLAVLIRSKFKDKKLWLQFLSFAAIAFPLGLWFPVRNYIKWQIPPTYVFELGRVANQDLSMYSPLQRLFGFSEVTMSIPYVVFDLNNRDFNIFTILFKSSLFDDFDHHDKPFFLILSIILFFLGGAMLIMFATGLVKTVIKAVKERSIPLISVLILLVTEFTSAVFFALKYPLICSVNFRYVFPTIICFALFTALCFTKSENEYIRLIQKITVVAVSCFCVMSVVFYACEWMAMPYF